MVGPLLPVTVRLSHPIIEKPINAAKVKSPITFVNFFILFYDETAGEINVPVKSKDIDAIKTDFLKSAAREFDAIINRLKN